ncbi:hypothetical protein AM1_B0392 (plasmid) [Acaryochloris marina MBIC11017]|uniref:Uncharacterized protein n=1 Tax=Acaryochloris marina (strain MBIC 11017) TaxID=329726 RepID=A8ZLT3_ACAM1|nr:hypothetical protein AM1_B0392 [Acaryochloris marina MBIC11017]
MIYLISYKKVNSFTSLTRKFNDDQEWEHHRLYLFQNIYEEKSLANFSQNPN